MKFFDAIPLGPKQSFTPEGFLLCQDVPIARTGTQLYLEGEIRGEEDGEVKPLQGANGIVTVHRLPEEVFSPETIQSFIGKPVTIDHPDDFVTPANWRALAAGHIQSVRRGEGVDADVLLADLLITDQEAIRLIRDGLREVSCGYEADYDQDDETPGVAICRNIRGNHLALVEHGRCGPRCAIGDSMKKFKFADKAINALRAAFETRDKAAFDKAIKDAEEETEEERKKREEEEADKKETKDSLAKLQSTLDAMKKSHDEMCERVKKLEDSDEEEDEEDEEEDKDVATADKKKRRSKDSAGLAGQAQEVYSRAELLSPGIKLPTFDSKADPAKTLDALCAIRRNALTAALAGEHRDAIRPLITKDVQKLTCDALHTAFVAASEVARARNNAAQKGAGNTPTQDSAKTLDLAAMNKRNEEFWSGRKAN